MLTKSILIKGLTHRKISAWLIFSIFIFGLILLDPALAKGGKNKNAQHGRGEVFRGLLDRIQKEGVPLVVGKKQRVKEATKHRNRIKAIGKTIRGVNHSMKHKK
jgi:hypothetical protein